MKKYLFDTNTISSLNNKKASEHEKILETLLAKDEDADLCISVLTIFEMAYAKANAPEEKQEKLQKFIDSTKEDYEILELTAEFSDLYGSLKAQLIKVRGIKKSNAKKHLLDVILASIAISKDLILISADGIYKDIQKVDPRLKWEDWTK